MAQAKIYMTKLMQSSREKLGWTRKELADLLAVSTGSNVSESMVNNWERGTHAVAPDIALEIAINLKVQLVDIVERR